MFNFTESKKYYTLNLFFKLARFRHLGEIFTIKLRKGNLTSIKGHSKVAVSLKYESLLSNKASI